MIACMTPSLENAERPEPGNDTQQVLKAPLIVTLVMDPVSTHKHTQLEIQAKNKVSSPRVEQDQRQLWCIFTNIF